MKEFLKAYYEWGCDQDIRKLVEGYKNYTECDVKFQKTPGAPDMTLSKSDLKEPYNMDNYRSFVGKLIWYTTKVGPDVSNVARELAVRMIHPRPEH